MMLELQMIRAYLEEVKEALFKKGAGQMGEYDCCAWQTKDNLLDVIIDELKVKHPYEEPGYAFYPINVKKKKK